MNNKGADQNARRRRLVCACVVRKSSKTGFLALWPILYFTEIHSCMTPMTHLKGKINLRGLEILACVALAQVQISGLFYMSSIAILKCH